MLTSREIGKFTGISERTIGSWIYKGIVPETADMAIAVTAIVKYYKSQLEEIKTRGSADEQELLAEKIRLTRAQADKVTLDIAEREQELVEAAKAAKVWGDYIGACRARLLSLPTKLAYELAGIAEPSLIEQTLKESVDEALIELADTEFVRRSQSPVSDRNDISPAAKTQS
ncbi:MAG: hypothetical protein ACRC11_11075 [Xenococcaceae cyanobacterium]